MSQTIQEQFAESTSEEIMQAIAETNAKKDKAVLMTMLRARLRIEENVIRDEIKAEAEDSKEEKTLLKKTHITFMETRKEYLAAYRAMNVIVNGMSMLKNLDDFSAKAAEYKEKAKTFGEALDAHLDNLAKVTRKATKK